MLWEYSMPKSLYDYIKLPENFEKLCDGKNSYKDANLIIKKYVYNKAFCNEFFEFFKKLLVVYQYIYSMLISKYYAQNDKFGIQNKVPFTLNYKHWKKNKVAEDKIILNNLRKILSILIETLRCLNNFQLRCLILSSLQLWRCLIHSQKSHYNWSLLKIKSINYQNKTKKQIKVVNDLKAKTQLDLKQKKRNIFLMLIKKKFFFKKCLIFKYCLV